MNQGPRTSRRRRNLWIAGGLLAAFTGFGFLVAPSIVKAQLERRASEALGRKVTVGKVRVNPYAMSLTLENLDVREPDGAGSFLGWSRLYVNADPLRSLVGPWTIGAVELDGFHAAAVLQKDGTFSFADIIGRLSASAPTPPAAPAKPPPAVRVDSLKVQGARLEFTDRSRPRPFATTLGPVSFHLTEFRTAAGPGAPYRFEAATEAGEKLAWSGTLSAVPLASVGELRLENILLPKYAPYYADLVQADLVDGKLSVGGRYEVKFDAAGKAMKLADGAVRLRGLKLVERTGQAVLVELPALDVTGVNADALALKAAIGSVVLQGGRIQVRREADGSINLLNALRPGGDSGSGGGSSSPDPTAKEQPPGDKLPPTAPDFLIGEVSVKDLAVDVTDLAAPRPAQLGLTGVQLSLKNVTLADGAEMPWQLALGWVPAGAVTVNGIIAIKPELKATLQADVAALSLLPLSPYLEQLVNARIAQGAISSRGAVRLALKEGVPAVTFDGGVTLDQFGLVDGANNEELAGFGSLGLNGLKAATGPQLEVSLAEVAVVAPYARVLVGKDGTLNLASLAKATATTGPAGNGRGSSSSDSTGIAPSPADKPPTAAEPAAAALPKVTIVRVVIVDGDFRFSDRSLEPNVRMAVTQFGGTIAGLSSENLARADVDLKASVDGAGPVAITGKLDPLGAKKFVDLQVDFKNVDLLPLSPYSGKYAGYELARGKLSLDVKAKLDGKQLDASNVVTLNQFTFGAPVESPDATKLPVRLGVALLKDLNGQIVIDIPVTGAVDDPSLRIGKVVGRVIVNVLTKAAVSPFALLGSMFGGGGDELAYQEFVPGSADLLPAEAGKLATMTKALANRPGLSLAIEGSCDGPADTHALKHRKFAALVRGRIWEEKHALDPNIAPPDRLEVGPEVHAAMVKRLFDEKFPPGTELGAPLPPVPVPVATPPAAKKGLFRRVVDVFTGSEKPAEAAKPAEAGPAAAEAAPTGPLLEEMTGRLAALVDVNENDLRALADARAQRVRDYFLNEGQIAADRLFLASGNAAAKENKGPRVFLSLQ